jgi:twitching motility protein PilT
VFKPIKSIVSQREMRADTHSWQVALRSVLREDPDVVFIGEMRDLETISSAITIAETGHLVVATLHTGSITGAVSRLRDIGIQPYELRHLLALCRFVWKLTTS